MAGDAQGPGNLKVGNFLAESSYGVMLTSQLAYAGNTIDLQLLPGSPYGQSFEHKEGTNIEFFEDEEIFMGGYTRTFRMRSGEHWKNYASLYGYGSTAGVPSGGGQRLGQFTFQNALDNASINYYQIFNGCKMNKLMISGRKPGAMLLFEEEVFAQWYQNSVGKAITGIQNLTLGADAAAVSSSKLIWVGNSQINLGAGGLANWFLEDWKITMDNQLYREPGVRTGGDSNPYYVPMGLNEGAGEILFETNIILKDMTYINAKVNKTLVTAITIPIDDDLITLSGGVILRDSFPKLTQEKMLEPIKVRFDKLVITTP